MPAHVPDPRRGGRFIEASVPIRICDIGGWTDTWFGGPGRVLNVAVRPGVQVRIVPSPDRGVTVQVESFGDRFHLRSPTASHLSGEPSRHPLLEAAIRTMPPPPERGIEITIRSSVPPGSGTGTSAAVLVALLGGLGVLRGEGAAPLQYATLAHDVEANALARETGVQDQISAALGGINYLEIDDYPEAVVTALPPWPALNGSLTLLFLGRGHDSSSLHRQVIEGDRPRRTEALARLREAAEAARRAVVERDARQLGAAMVANTEAQALLHPDLIGTDATRAIEIASRAGATGWKVNGAGGEGGSLTVLHPDPERKADMERMFSGIAGSDGMWRVLPIRTSGRGLSIRDLWSGPGIG